MARFANTIDELPIYAARAEADKNGDVIDTTYQKKLTAGSGINIDENNVISATGGGGGGGGGDLPPSTASDAGRVLTVANNGDPFLNDPQSDLPSSTSSDEGKVLTVDSNGDPVWDDPHVGDVTDVKVNNVSVVDNNGVANITVPTNTSDLNNDSGFVTSSDLPTVNDGVLTIKKNGTTIDTFTANSGSDKTVNIAVPTKTSDLTNDSNFITSSDIPAQVQADWTETDTSSKAYIAHKPTIPSGNQLLPAATSADEDKVLTVDSNGDPTWQTPQGGGSQVQSDWTENDNTDPSYIQHKPTTKPISAGVGISIVEYADNVRITNTVDPQVQADWAENDNSEPDFIQNKPGVKQIVAGANVTITEAQGQITISSTGAGGVTVQADWTQQDSAQPDFIKNKPSIPSAQVNADWTAASGVAQVLHKPTTKPIVAGTGIVITETANEIIISLA